MHRVPAQGQLQAWVCVTPRALPTEGTARLLRICCLLRLPQALQLCRSLLHSRKQGSLLHSDSISDMQRSRSPPAQLHHVHVQTLDFVPAVAPVAHVEAAQQRTVH